MGPRSGIFIGGKGTSKLKEYRKETGQNRAPEWGGGRRDREILTGLEHLQYLTNTGSEEKKKIL